LQAALTAVAEAVAATVSLTKEVQAVAATATAAKQAKPARNLTIATRAAGSKRSEKMIKLATAGDMESVVLASKVNLMNEGGYGFFGVSTLHIPHRNNVIVHTVAVKSARQNCKSDLRGEILAYRKFATHRFPFLPQFYGVTALGELVLEFIPLPLTPAQYGKRAATLGKFSPKDWGPIIVEYGDCSNPSDLGMTFVAHALEEVASGLDAMHGMQMFHGDVRDRNVGVKAKHGHTGDISCPTHLQIVLMDIGNKNSHGTFPYARHVFCPSATHVTQASHVRNDSFAALMISVKCMATTTIGKLDLKSASIRDQAKKLGENWSKSNQNWVDFIMNHKEENCSHELHTHMCTTVSKWKKFYEHIKELDEKLTKQVRTGDP
jgi:hypothetical protein